MKAQQLRRSGGFTIFETLIVLAVSSAMLIGALALISGRQGKAQFSQAIQVLQTSIQKSINEVSSGYYNNDGSYKCVAGVTGPRFMTTGGAPAQGENTSCIFVGKALQFAVGNTTPEQYYVYTVGGLRGTPLSADAYTDFAQIKPRLVATDLPSKYEAVTMPYGLKVSSMTVNGTPIDAVAFTASTGSLGSGDVTQQVNVVGILPPPGPPPLHRPEANGVNEINAGIPTGPLNPAAGVQICVTDGTYWALYTIGGTGRQSLVEVAVKGVNCT